MRIALSSNFIAVSIILSLFHVNSYAQDLKGPVAGAMGGAGIAANDMAEQMFLNPAVLSHTEGIAGGYFFQGGYSAPQSRDEFGALAITDNTEGTLFSGGVLASRRNRSFPGNFDFRPGTFRRDWSRPIQHLYAESRENQ